MDQCNCVTTRGAHLSAAMFERFPHADVYAGRRARSVPGTIVVRGDAKEDGERLVVNLFGQYYPGRSRFDNDSADKRRVWFQTCLAQVAGIPGLTSVAFPHGIGCGAAGGHWPEYHRMLAAFAATVPHVRVVLYKLPPANINPSTTTSSMDD